jgi:DNA polymerase-3 subunit alpha
VDPGVLTKKVLESLILAGAFDSLGLTRRGLLENQERVSAPIAAERKAEALGQFSLFGGGDRAATDVDESVLAGEEFDKRTLLREEKTVLGQFVTDHPLLGIQDSLAAQTDMEMPDVANLGDGDVVVVGGIVAAVQRKFTKNGDPYAVFRLEDLTGGVSIVAFPNVFSEVAQLIEADAILLVKGKVDLRGRELQLRALEIREPDLGLAPPPRAANGVLVLDVVAQSCTGGLIAKLKELLGAHPGPTPVRVRYQSSSGTRELDVGGVRVEPGAGLLSELRIMLGRDAVRIEEPSRAGGERVLTIADAPASGERVGATG